MSSLSDITGLLDITIDVNQESPNFTQFLDNIVDDEVKNEAGCRHYEVRT